MGVDVGAVGAVGWFWLKVVGVAKSLPFMGLEVVGGVGPSELARGDFGATVGRASSLFALSLAPLPSEGHWGGGDRAGAPGGGRGLGIESRGRETLPSPWMSLFVWLVPYWFLRRKPKNNVINLFFSSLATTTIIK